MKILLSKFCRKLGLVGYPYKPFTHRYKCIFIHIPKSAGTSVLHTLGDTGARWHVSWLHFRRAAPDKFNKYFRFSIVRHPVSRLYSAYQYMLSGGNQSVNDKLLQEKIITNSTTFDEFVKHVLTFETVMDYEVFKPQYGFIFDKTGKCQVNEVIRFENLALEWQRIANKHNFPIDLARKNITSPHSDNNACEKTILKQLSSESIDRIRIYYQRDFDLLNYTI
ncbi:sulfotransferase family 2 domain-containing protein [Thalassotalea fusca]